MEHLDIVKNEWSAATQWRLAKIAQTNGHIGSVLTNDGRWSDVADRLTRNPQTGEQNYPSKMEPAEGFGLLIAAYSGDFVFATQVHDDDMCPFRESNIIPMTTLDVG